MIEKMMMIILIRSIINSLPFNPSCQLSASVLVSNLSGNEHFHLVSQIVSDPRLIQDR